MVDGGWFYRGGFFSRCHLSRGFVEGSKPAHEELKKKTAEIKAKSKARGLLSSFARSELWACVLLVACAQRESLHARDATICEGISRIG
jgi:hypothetical protein